MQSALLFALPLMSVALFLEWRWARRHGRVVHDGPETLATLGVLLGNRLSRYTALPLMAAVHATFAPYAIAELPLTPAVFLLGLLVMDFVYYWYHRLSHEIPFLWAMHQTHHTPEHINLLAAARLNWLGPWLVQPVLVVPMVLLGFPVEVAVGVAAVDLVFQFFLHTEAVPRLPWLEGWLNTPAAHRFHHAKNERCLDVNYGGILVVWDRLFGTWVEPDLPVEELEYGLTTGPQGNNPLWLVFGGLVRWARREPV